MYFTRVSNAYLMLVLKNDLFPSFNLQKLEKRKYTINSHKSYIGVLDCSCLSRKGPCFQRCCKIKGHRAARQSSAKHCPVIKHSLLFHQDSAWTLGVEGSDS